MPLHFHLANAKIKLNYDLDIMIKHLLFDFASLSIPVKADSCMNNFTRNVEKCSYSAFLFLSVTFELLLLIYLKTRFFYVFFYGFFPCGHLTASFMDFCFLCHFHTQLGGIFFYLVSCGLQSAISNVQYR